MVEQAFGRRHGMKNGAEYPRRFSCFASYFTSRPFRVPCLGSAYQTGYEMKNSEALLHNKKSGMESMPLFAC